MQVCLATLLNSQHCIYILLYIRRRWKKFCIVCYLDNIIVARTNNCVFFKALGKVYQKIIACTSKNLSVIL